MKNIKIGEKSILLNLSEKQMTNKSPKTQVRINEIKQQIKEHKKNIAGLKQYLERNKNLLFLSYPRRIDKSTFIPVWAKQFHWTIKNLSDQIIELEKEFAILNQYGA
jgi:hypothetical protein